MDWTTGEWWKSGMDNFSFYFHYLSCCSFPVVFTPTDCSQVWAPILAETDIQIFRIYPFEIH